MKPVFGNAATSAPKAAFVRSTPPSPARRLSVVITVKATIASAQMP